jgi:hypothetical protein
MRRPVLSIINAGGHYMGQIRSVRGRTARTLLATAAAAALVLSMQSAAGAQTPGSDHRRATKPPKVAGMGEVARPAVARPAGLPRRSGSVAVNLAASAALTTHPDRTKTAPRAAAATGATDQVALRALIVATNTGDFGVPTLKTTLDRLGMAYDVLYDATDPLTTDTLVRADGVGRYNAVLLTNSMQIYESNGSYLNGLDAGEWNILWAYERNFGVRQVALYTSYGTWPENYCLAGTSEGGVGDTPLNASLTPAGAGVFDYLKSAAQIPVVQSYVYHTAVTPGCSADPVLTAGSDVLGVRTTSTDGRERLALTFTSNQYLLQSDLLVYGLIRWATKGLFLGEQKHYLNVDIDDWFNTSDHYYPDGHVEYTPGFQVSAHDMVNLDNKQTALRTEHPQAAGFEFNLAFNGGDIDPFAGDQCSPDGDATQLTATTKCLKTHFRWLNHTLNHPELNFTDLATTTAEISNNRAAGAAIGLSSPDDVLKTPEYSGLGVYSPDPDDDTDPPVDHGLAGSNPNLIQAAENLGIKYFHGNMSFASHVPANFNTNIPHPMDTGIGIVPDWPTNIAYFTTAPDEETHFYNSFYGPNGKFPYWPTDRNYAEIVDYEAGVGLQHVASGAINTHTFHIANVRDYGSGNTLVMDWVDSVVDKYEAHYSVPLLNTDWHSLAEYTSVRNAHFAELSGGVDPVYDRSTGLITVTSPVAGTVQISGVQASNSSTYGTDISAPVDVQANTPVTLTAVPRT